MTTWEYDAGKHAYFRSSTACCDSSSVTIITDYDDTPLNDELKDKTDVSDWCYRAMCEACEQFPAEIVTMSKETP